MSRRNLWIRAISFLVDHTTKDRFFMSKDFMKNEFTPFTSGVIDVKENDSTIAAIGMCVAASRSLTQDGQSLKLQFTGVTNAGRDVGNYTIEITRDSN